jgi:tubulin epsilon|tara:strand:+ start:12230 stop:13591 length:1362 start_codon:yes stop_codon:yes gene_type:complete
LKEHAAYNTKARYDDALSSFFQNVDTRHEPAIKLPVGDGKGSIRALKARAVVVDMEEGVTNELLSGPMRDVFDTKQFITGQSGSGNNWACGSHHYGPMYRDTLLEAVRRQAEDADSLQSFLLLHSLGGGTGSGLGSYMLGALADEYPDVYRFSVSVFPSEDDDVVTSPYNAMLSCAALAEHADCVMPVENQALMDIVTSIQSKSLGSQRGSSLSGLDSGDVGGRAGHGGKPWDGMNGIAANLLLNLTAGMRFDGSLNVDINEITTNLVPFPKLHFLLSSMSPVAVSADRGRNIPAPRTMDQIFTEVFGRDRQLASVDPRRSTYLACALMLRGGVNISDANRNVERLRRGLKMAHWVSDGFKVGLCDRAPVGTPYSALCLANNCAMQRPLDAMNERFGKLRKRNVYLHHYTEYMDLADIDGAAECIQDLGAEYGRLDIARVPDTVPSIEPLGIR